ncbi:putative mitochondrial protein, partial [Mucuna pruriens]
MSEANSIASRMVGGCILTKTCSIFLPSAIYYKFVVNVLQYVSITHPKIGFSINKYLKVIVSWALLLQPTPSHSPLILQAYYDVDWASDPNDHQSSFGASLFLGPNLMSWWSKKQTIVVRSNTKFEYQSLALATFKVTWIQTLLSKLHVINKLLQVIHVPVVDQCVDILTKALSLIRFLTIWTKLRV